MASFTVNSINDAGSVEKGSSVGFDSCFGISAVAFNTTSGNYLVEIGNCDPACGVIGCGSRQIGCFRLNG